jgi:methylthioribose-1-phosphate isomerase
LAAHDNRVPFYVALPVSTIDWSIDDGVKNIPIETRAPEEVTAISGLTADGKLGSVQLTPEGSAALNYAFDVTPRRFVTGLVTEFGVFPPLPEEMIRLRQEAERPSHDR